MKIVALCIALSTASFGLGWYASPGPAPMTEPHTAPTEAEVRAVLGEGSRLTRLNRLTRLLDGLDEENLDGVLAVYDREITSMLGECEIQPLFEAWTGFDPVAAMAHAGGWPLASKRRMALGAAVQGWALREPLAAKQAVEDWIQSVPRLRQTLIEDLVIGWVHSGEPGALDYVVGLPESWRIPSSVALVGAQARRLDTEALLAWADDALVQVADAPKFQREIFRRVARSVGRRDPLQLARWVERHAGEAHAVDGPPFVVEYWLPADPDGALDWITAHADEAERERVIRLAAMLWLKRAPQAAGAWLEASELDAASREAIRDSVTPRRGRPPRGVPERVEETPH